MTNITDQPVHLIWIGNPMPDQIKECMNTAFEIYKDHPLYLWTESNVFETGNGLGHEYMQARLLKDLKLSNVRIMNVHDYDYHEIFTQCTYEGQDRVIAKGLRLDIKCDLYRLCILQEYGGIYLDSDYYHLKSYANELAKHEAALVQCNRQRIHGNGVMYVNRPNHPWINDCIARCISYPNFLYNRILYCGPNAAYKTRNANKDRYEVYSIPFEHFFTHAWEEIEKICSEALMNHEQPDLSYEPRNDLYAIHLWYDVLSQWEQALHAKLNIISVNKEPCLTVSNK